jgi:hypothetical protein
MEAFGDFAHKKKTHCKTTPVPVPVPVAVIGYCYLLCFGMPMVRNGTL